MKDDYFYQTDNIPPIDVEQIRDWSLDNLQCYIPEPQEVIKDDFSKVWLEAYHNYPSK